MVTFYCYTINDHHWLCTYCCVAQIHRCTIFNVANPSRLTASSICLYKSVRIHHYCYRLLVMYGKYSTWGGVSYKYRTQLCLVLYLLPDPTPCTVFSIHHSQWCFNITYSVSTLHNGFPKSSQTYSYIYMDRSLFIICVIGFLKSTHSLMRLMQQKTVYS